MEHVDDQWLNFSVYAKWWSFMIDGHTETPFLSLSAKTAVVVGFASLILF